MPPPQRRSLVRLVVVLACLGLAPSRVAAQVLPPIYKPLAVEEGARFRAAADSLRKRGAELTERASVLEEGARTLRQNGTGVAEKLAQQAAEALREASLLDVRASADVQTARALRGQSDEFRGRAESAERAVAQSRDSVARLQAPAVPTDTLTPVAPDSLAADRIRSLRAAIQADSQTAATFRAQSAELAGRAQALEAGAAAARERVAELRRQHAQLQGFATEILSGRGAAEPTVAHLESEARQLRASAERHEQAAKGQEAQDEALRAQAQRSWLPVRSRTEAMRFYGEDGRSVLRSVVLALGEGVIPRSANGEVVSDYAGPVRVGVGVVIAKSGAAADSTRSRDAALKRFYAGGGNLVMHTTLPLLFDRSHYHSLTVQTLAKVALDAPGSGRATEAEAVPTNLDLGVEAYATLNTFASRIKAFALLRSAVAVGNAAFHRNLERDPGPLPYLQLTFGTEVASLAKILLSGARAADGMGQEMAVTVQLAR